MVSFESLSERRFSFKSDVWALGVVLWEVISGAKRPYSQWDNIQTITEVVKGSRLPLPAALVSGRLEPLGSAISDCWKEEAAERPTAQEIFERLSAVTPLVPLDGIAFGK